MNWPKCQESILQTSELLRVYHRENLTRQYKLTFFFIVEGKVIPHKPTLRKDEYEIEYIPVNI